MVMAMAMEVLIVMVVAICLIDWNRQNNGFLVAID